MQGLKQIRARPGAWESTRSGLPLYGNLATWDLCSTEELAMQISIGGVESVPMGLPRRAARITEALELMRIEAIWEKKDSPTQLAELEPAYREQA